MQTKFNQFLYMKEKIFSQQIPNCCTDNKKLYPQMLIHTASAFMIEPLMLLFF